MNGREEKEKWYERKNNNLIKSMPSIASKYYVYFKMSASKRTEASCFTYLSKLKQYFNYLYNNGINVNAVTYYRKIKPIDITIYLDYYRKGSGKQNGDSAVAGMFNAIKSFYSFLEDNEYIDKNPCSRLKAPKVEQNNRPVVMTTDEVKKVKDQILYADKTYYNNDNNEEYWRLRDYLIFVIGCRTGLRCSAIVGINVDDINMEENIITVIEKGGKPRHIRFGENTKEVIVNWLVARSRLLRYKENSDALFISKKRNRLSSCEVGKLIHKYTSDALPNKHITPHKMRSTCATNLWEQTHDIYIVANQLGHKNLANTKRYTDISESESRKVANILDEL